MTGISTTNLSTTWRGSRRHFGRQDTARCLLRISNDFGLFFSADQGLAWFCLGMDGVSGAVRLI